MNLLIAKSGQVSKPFLDKIDLQSGDITQACADAIVLLISTKLEFGGSLHEAVAGACGYDLDGFILEHIYKPRAGEVYALPGGRLPARHILLGIVPAIRDPLDREEGHLSGITRKVMEMARCMLLQDIAFPPLGAGRGGYPPAKSARLVLQGITDRLEERFTRVQIICRSEEMRAHYQRKLDAFRAL